MDTITAKVDHDLSDLHDLSELPDLADVAGPPAAPAEPTTAEPTTAEATTAEASLAAATATPSTGDDLADQQRAILDFERQWWRFAGAKEQAIRDRFALSPTRYYQTLNALLDAPAALAYDPALVKRLRRLRATRLRARGHRS